LLFVLVWPTYLLVGPSLVAEAAEQDAWLANLLGGLEGLAVLLLLLGLVGLAPGKDLVQAAEEALGRVGGKVAGCSILLVISFATYTTLRSSTVFIKEVFLPVTPQWSIGALVATQGILGALYGLEAVSRSAGITLVLLFGALGPSAVLMFSQFDPRLLFPVLARGFAPVLRGASQSASFLGELVVLGMLLPALRGKRCSAPLLAGLGAAWVVTGGLMAVTQGILGWYGISRQPLSLLESLRVVRAPPLLERIEVAVASTWVLVSFCKVAVLFIAQALAAEGTLAHLQNAKSARSQADWLLDVNLMCKPKAAVLTVTAVERATQTVVWTKKHSLPRADQAQATVESIARGLIAFAKEGAETDPAAGNGRGLLALLPLADRSGRFQADQLARLDEHLRQRLIARGYHLVDQKRVAAWLGGQTGDVRAETFVVRLAETTQSAAGMSAWLSGDGDQCAFHFLLVPVAADGEDRTAAVQVGCSLLDLKEGISQLVEQL
jgi:spore germination protein KB